jgi:hypothetical protein
MYPLLLRSAVSDEAEQIDNEEQFIQSLRKILSSPEIQRVVGALLNQAREAP